MNFRQSYREATVQGANPVALVVRLYEQMIADMHQVAIAIGHNDIPRRTDRIRHVLLVIAHLQSTLDFAQGGKVAQDLDNFYNALRQNVVWVQFHPSTRAATQVVTDLLAVREAWVQVERDEVERNHVERSQVERNQVQRNQLERNQIERTENPSLATPSRTPSAAPDRQSNDLQSDSLRLDDAPHNDGQHIDWQG